MTQRSLGYEGEMVHTDDDPLWPVTAATVSELPEEYVQGAFNNLDSVEVQEADLEAMEVPTVPGWHSAEGQFLVKRENVLPEHSGPSCLATGKHRIVLPPMDPKAKAFLDQQRERFLNNESVEKAEGYVPPTTDANR